MSPHSEISEINNTVHGEYQKVLTSIRIFYNNRSGLCEVDCNKHWDFEEELNIRDLLKHSEGNQAQQMILRFSIPYSLQLITSYTW